MDRRSLAQQIALSGLSLLSCLLAVAARAETTPQQPSAAQPTLPDPTRSGPPKPGSPVVEEMVKDKPALVVRKRTTHKVRTRRNGLTHRQGPALHRPALAGVTLAAPLLLPPEPSHYFVPTPAYPLDALASAYLTPPPPIVCRPTRRDPTQPDPGLYNESPVACEADNP